MSQEANPTQDGPLERIHRLLGSNPDDVFAAVATAVAVLTFILWKRQDLHPQPSDENIYFYLASRVAHGQVPYRDFFFSHGPLQLYVLAGIHGLFGFNFTLLKSTALAATCVSAGFVALTARRLAGSLAAPVAAILFLFSVNTWFTSSINFGTEIGAMFCAAAFYFYCRRRFGTAGVLAGLALLTTVQTLAVPLVLSAALLWEDRKGLVRFAAATLAVFVLVTLPLVLLAGFGPVYGQLLGYHAAKPSSPFDVRLGRFLNELQTNAVVFVAAVLAPFGQLLRSREGAAERPAETDRQRWCVLVAGLVVGVHLLLLVVFAHTLFRHYFTLAVVFLSVIGARTLAGGLTGRRPRAAALLVLLLALLWTLTGQERRTAGHGSALTVAGDVAGFVSANSAPGDEIFGDDYSTPLIALLAHRRISLDQADTNPTTFESGAIRVGELVQRLSRKPPRFMIFHEWGDLATIWDFEEVRTFTRARCRPGTLPDFVEFAEVEGQTIRVYGCFSEAELERLPKKRD